MRFQVFLIVAAFACFVEGALFTDINQLSKRTYDFVVVGGKIIIRCSCDSTELFFSLYTIAGAAGNVVASRLSENPNFSVLVIEAGVTYVVRRRCDVNSLTEIAPKQ